MGKYAFGIDQCDALLQVGDRVSVVSQCMGLGSEIRHRNIGIVIYIFGRSDSDDGERTYRGRPNRTVSLINISEMGECS